MERRKRYSPEELEVIEARDPEKIDRDNLVGEVFNTEPMLTAADLPYYVEVDAGADVSSEQDDHNPYQNSDEALPDDGDESVRARNPKKQPARFSDV